MAAKVIVLLPVREGRREDATLRRPQVTVVKKGLFAEGACRPAHHSRTCHCDPIDATSFVRNKPTNLLEAAAAKQLAPAGDMILSLKTLLGGAIAFFFEHGSC